MKSSRFIKLKTTAHGPVDVVMEQNHNPLRRHVAIEVPSHEYTKRFLQNFQTAPDLDAVGETPYVFSLLRGYET
jgi:proteasome activator subunit 4